MGPRRSRDKDNMSARALITAHSNWVQSQTNSNLISKYRHQIHRGCMEDVEFAFGIYI